jgi:hypothetical protein
MAAFSLRGKWLRRLSGWTFRHAANLRKNFPQGLKATSILLSLRHEETRALSKRRVFQQAVKPCPFKTRSFSARCEVVHFHGRFKLTHQVPFRP